MPITLDIRPRRGKLNRKHPHYSARTVRLSLSAVVVESVGRLEVEWERQAFIKLDCSNESRFGGASGRHCVVSLEMAGEGDAIGLINLTMCICTFPLHLAGDEGASILG